MLQIAIVVPFLDEQRQLPALLTSLAAQERRPDQLVLVDDGSRDGSAAVARAFAAEHAWARVLTRPRRRAVRDRLAEAAELSAFTAAVARLQEPWDVAAKLDADLRLAVDVIAEAERHFAAEPRVGIAGPQVSERRPDGRLVPLRSAPGHVEGAARFYRRACLEAVTPLPPILGWDTIDEVRARMSGWETGRFGARAEHLRRMGSRDGTVRGYARAGRAAYAYGADPLYLLASAGARLSDRPQIVCGAAYLAGFAAAAAGAAPRAEPEARLRIRSEQRRRLAVIARRGRP
jgi:glycosyltransferase involved in cell wall biosynthesis